MGRVVEDGYMKNVWEIRKLMRKGEWRKVTKMEEKTKIRKKTRKKGKGQRSRKSREREASDEVKLR